MGKPPGVSNELFTYERKKRHWTQGDVADKISAPDERLIRRWERGEVAPTPHYRGKLAEVFGKSARALGFPPNGQIPFWHMPYRRNAFFTGREDILQLLRDAFLAQHVSPVPRLPLALSGLAGVGKSQIALEYTYRYREHYHTVLWLHAASYQELVSDVIAAADLLDLPGKDAANPAQLTEALKEWLTQLTRWLLIFDNVENLQLLEGFLPAEIKGHLLLTTRSQNTGTHAHRIAVEPMDNNTGAGLLLRRAKLIAIESTLVHMAAADAAIARSLSEDMGGLPLALDQAGAYIEETAVSLSEYVKRYQEERRNLLDRRGSWAGDSEHPLPVAATFKLSFDKAGEQHPLAMDILRFCAFLSPDAIPEELFQHDESFKHGTTVFDEAIAALLRYSMIKRNTHEQTLSMHRLVQAVLIDDMPPDLQKQWIERVVRALNAAFPEVEFTNWKQCGRLLPHALVCARWTEDELTMTQEVFELLTKAAVYLQEQGQYSEAEDILFRALKFWDKQLGVSHPTTGAAAHRLAQLYKKQGKYSLAKKLYRWALIAYEKHLGIGHPAMAAALSELGTLYAAQRKYKNAFMLISTAVIIQRHRLGDNHPATLRSLSDLGTVLRHEGKYDAAIRAYKEALASCEHEGSLGINHPDTMNIVRELGMAYVLKGDYELAEPLLMQSANFCMHYLGVDHPDMAKSLICLAWLYYEQGKYKQSNDLYLRLLASRKRRSKMDVLDTARAYYGWALVLHKQRSYELAEKLYRRAIQIYEREVGGTSAYAPDLKKSYAALLRDMQRHTDAEAVEASDDPPYDYDKDEVDRDMAHYFALLGTAYRHSQSPFEA